jgi:hypothetical protein
MAIGRRKNRVRTLGLWIAASELSGSGGHPFYQRLNQVLDAHDSMHSLKPSAQRIRGPVAPAATQ